MKRLMLAVVCCVVAVGLMTGCQTEPVTGRRQLILISQSQEMQLGEQAYAQVLKENTLSDNRAADAILQRVGQRIAAVADSQEFRDQFGIAPLGFEWEFKLIESEQVNAFCLPGGKVAFYTGIFPFCKTEAGMAAVMGHEIGHAIAHHGAERISHQMLAQFGAAGIGLAVKNASPAAQQIALQAYGVGANVGVLLPFSRTEETSADEIGLHLMARAGYDPSEAVELWKRMSADETQKPMELLSTHPASERRIKELEGLQPGALQLYRQAAKQYGAGELLPVIAAPAK